MFEYVEDRFQRTTRLTIRPLPFDLFFPRSTVLPSSLSPYTSHSLSQLELYLGYLCRQLPLLWYPFSTLKALRL